ncbi:hypothetical protein [Massilia orientalis]|uniref:Uncharacterized protein n=1 Tax=Massilia orientalis TaxID=3050128 RepID=A0ACC7MDV6_9BURK|nr:hypothetical protein [Massilia sp. YIM B02787]
MMKSACLFFAGCLSILAGAAQADDGPSVTLRAANEPDSVDKQWQQGAHIAYQTTDGKSKWQTDAVLKLKKNKPYPLGATPDSGSVNLSYSAGAYLHKDTDDATPANDRGVSIGVSAHGIPGGPAGQPVLLDYDADLTAQLGKTLQSTDGAGAAPYFDANSRRIVLTGAAYMQPRDWNAFFRFALGAYSDMVSNSPTGTKNGRESGWLGSAQFSFYPLGFGGQDNVFLAMGLNPVLTLKATKEFDRSVSGNRIKSNYALYSAVLSFPFSASSNGGSKFVPSLDIKRSTGDDLLQGRSRKGQTSVQFSLKY